MKGLILTIFQVHAQLLNIANLIADLDVLERVTVKYETFTGWKEDISGIRKPSELPLNAKKYIMFIQNFLGVKIEWVGVGPGRQAMLTF
jgi:adenylosuccinate synthase